MRILHCVFTRSLFGSERYAADLARLQRQMGHEVHIAVDPRAEVQTILSPGITVHRVPWLARRLRLKRLIATLKPDIAHAHLSAACKALGAIAKRPPAVATLHVGYKPKQHARLDGLIALTEGAAARIHGYRGKVTRLWNWAPAMADPGPEARAAIRGELGVGPQTFLVGFVGRLHPSKDPQTLVRAFRAAALADSMLALAGARPGPARVGGLAAGAPAIRPRRHRTRAATVQAFPRHRGAHASFPASVPGVRRRRDRGLFRSHARARRRTARHGSTAGMGALAVVDLHRRARLWHPVLHRATGGGGKAGAHGRNHLGRRQSARVHASASTILN